MTCYLVLFRPKDITQNNSGHNQNKYYNLPGTPPTYNGSFVSVAVVLKLLVTGGTSSPSTVKRRETLRFSARTVCQLPLHRGKRGFDRLVADALRRNGFWYIISKVPAPLSARKYICIWKGMIGPFKPGH